MSTVSNIEPVVILLSESLAQLTAALFGLDDHDIAKSIESCFPHLYDLCAFLRVPLDTLVSDKMKVNKLKYKPDICKKRRTIIRYTEDARDTNFIELLRFHERIQCAKKSTKE